MLCHELEDEDLANFARAWNKIGGVHGIVNKFNIVRNRELQCFVLKKSFNKAKLGVGVSITSEGGRKGTIASEFDLLSRNAYEAHDVRTSVQGISFTHWLPLPLSRRHYIRVKDEVNQRLRYISSAARLGVSTPCIVIYHLMNDVVVKLSESAKSATYNGDLGQYYRDLNRDDQNKKSTLKHASEKAIESYFHLFHLLLCLATSDRSIVRSANKMLHDFLNGQTSKTHCPNLGHLLLAVLIADIDLTQDLLMMIIKEAIVRNVVWMLDKRGSGMADLAYLEPDAISEHCLAKTFEASKTSYRLLMFFNLFRCTIKRGEGPKRKALEVMRDELLDSHGMPPLGTAATLAAKVKEVQEVDNFPRFLSIMGVREMPSKSVFTKLLRDSIQASMDAGYSIWGLSQENARLLREGTQGVNIGSFFPNAGGKGGRRAGQRGR